MRTAEALKIAADVVDAIEFRSGTVFGFSVTKTEVSFGFTFDDDYEADKRMAQIYHKSAEQVEFNTADKVRGTVVIKF